MVMFYPQALQAVSGIAMADRVEREITGHSRGKFLRLLESGDESCWIYRSWL